MLKIVGGMEVYGFALFGLGTYLHRVHRRHGAWKRGGGNRNNPFSHLVFFCSKRQLGASCIDHHRIIGACHTTSAS
jgi:hypothetical protein